MLQTLQNGQFTPYLQIGRTLFENDDLVLSQTLTPEQQTALPGNFVYRPFREKTINMLKHRLLVFLYKRAAARSLEELRRFFQHFDNFRALRIWKMQMLDDQHFLLKYASEDVVTLRSPEPNLQVNTFRIQTLGLKHTCNTSTSHSPIADFVLRRVQLRDDRSEVRLREHIGGAA